MSIFGSPSSIETSPTDGGAIYSMGQMTQTNIGFFRDIDFLGNRSENDGGAFHGTFSDDTFINTVFAWNEAAVTGGGLFTQDSRPQLINSTVAFNTCGDTAGGVRGDTDNSFLANSILWGNRDVDESGLTGQVSGPFEVADTLIEGGCQGNLVCTGNTGTTDPEFVDPDGPDDVPGTLDDDFGIGPNSPAIDSGSNQHLPLGVTEDIRGNPRIVNGRVDQGAFEAQTILLQKPANVLAGAAVQTIRLSWDSNSEDYLLGYNVYRSTEPILTSENEVRLNNDGLLLDPTFVDNTVATLPPGTSLYYQVEAVAATQGLTLDARSLTVEAILGQYTLYLPSMRVSEDDTLSRYPISILNARGLIEDGMELVLTYPDFIENVSFERTALTEGFDVIAAEVNPASRRIRIFDSNFKGIATPGVLNGEGSLFNLTFNVVPATPLGTTGSISLGTPVSQLQTSSGLIVTPEVVGPGGVRVENEYRLGDVNGDGIVSASDVVLAASFALGVPFTPIEFFAGDMNGDRLLDIADLNLIRSRAGLKAGAKGDAIQPKGGVPGTWQLDLADASFSSIPGDVEIGSVDGSSDGDLRGNGRGRDDHRVCQRFVGVERS